MPQLTPETVARFRPVDDLVPYHWASGSVTAADGTRLHWTDTGGDGPPIVLVHGVQADGLTWLRTARALESQHRVVMPDLRGHGRSGRIRGAVSTGIHVDDVRTVLATLGVERPVVVGHSMGAEVAGRLATVDDLRGVVLVDPPLRDLMTALDLDFDTPPSWVRTLFDTLRTLRTQPHPQRMVTGLALLPPGGTGDWDEADYVSYVEAQSRFDLDLYRHQALDGGLLVDSPDVVADIVCPILLLTARPMLPGVDVDAAVAALSARWRDGRHVHFPDSGHAIAIDQFDRFVDVVRRFAADVDAGR